MTQPTKPVTRTMTETTPRTPAGDAPEFDTRQLFAGRTEIRIAHADAVYRLRITRAGKLILNK